MLKRVLGALSALFLLSACGAKLGTDTTTTSFNKLYGDIGSESSFCSSVSTPSPATTVSLTAPATYEYYVVSSSLGLNSTSSKPIRKAEVQVLNSAGSIIQCGSTLDDGTISIDIPRVDGSYTLKVLSRAFNSSYKASVLDNSTSMTPYAISIAFTLSGTPATKTVTLPHATYNGTLEGGAFNILDQIYTANAYIKAQTNTGCTPPACSTFTEAGKVLVFWTPGMSPAAYYGQPSKATSFYTSSDDSALGMASGIYLLGGIQGSLCADTDHFDNSVILHEYGHFLENDQARSDSPGGSHNGNAIIDPRLAWSEGWGNFIQGAIRGSSEYVDTVGNSACSGGSSIGVYLDLENKQVSHDYVGAGTYSGEGIFREVSVSRILWDTMTTTGDTDGFGANLGFKYIWNIFSDATVGFRNSAMHFRNVGLFNENMSTLIGANASYSAAVSNEKQLLNRKEYANPVTITTPGTCTIDIQGTSGVDNLAKSHDFYMYYYDGTAAHATVTLRYAATPSGTPSDLDLYIWKEGYSFSDTSTLAGKSERFYPESGGTGNEVVSLSGLAAGYYLIQVAVDPSSVHTTARYYLEVNGGSDRLCPTF